MKLLVLTSTYPYLNGQHNQPRFINTLCLRLAPFHDVHVLAPSIKGQPSRQRGKNLTLFRYGFAKLEALTGSEGISANLKRQPLLLLMVPCYLISLILHIRQVVIKKKINLIHAHWIIPQGFCAILARRIFRLNIPVVITSHGGDLYGLRGKMMMRLKRWILGQADHITVVSRAMKTYCVTHLNCDPQKINVCPMGVDLKTRFVPGAEGRDPNRIIFVGRLVEKKGVDVLIRAMAMVLETHPEVRLDIIGGGSALGRYKKLTSSMGVSRQITFLGPVPNSLVHRHYQKAALAVLPFRVAKDGDQEGLGLTMVEAIGCGCIVIASDLPAVRDVIEEGTTGFLVPPDDPASLARRINALMASKDSLKAIRGQARKRMIEQFDWNVVAGEYARLLSHSLRAYSE